MKNWKEVTNESKASSKSISAGLYRGLYKINPQELVIKGSRSQFCEEDEHDIDAKVYWIKSSDKEPELYVSNKHNALFTSIASHFETKQHARSNFYRHIAKWYNQQHSSENITKTELFAKILDVGETEIVAEVLVDVDKSETEIRRFEKDCLHGIIDLKVGEYFQIIISKAPGEIKFSFFASSAENFQVYRSRINPFVEFEGSDIFKPAPL